MTVTLHGTDDELDHLRLALLATGDPELILFSLQIRRQLLSDVPVADLPRMMR